MINRLSNPLNCNRSAAKISKVILSKIGHSGEAGGQPLHSALPSRGPDDQDFWGEEAL